MSRKEEDFEQLEAVNAQLLKALVNILAEVRGRLGTGPSSAASTAYIREQAFAAITAAKGDA